MNTPKNTSIFQGRIEFTRENGEQWAYEQSHFYKLTRGAWVHQFSMVISRANVKKVIEAIELREQEEGFCYPW